MTTVKPLTWNELEQHATFAIDTVNGSTNSQARLRLFGQSEDQIRVTLYRDNHGWCPYCQKVWLWLEEKQIPYRIEKVTMFCYGEKERWYKQIVPSGMLPAIQLDGRLITESDEILIALERVFGPLGISLLDPIALPLRQLERLLFRAWCSWLCYPSQSQRQDRHDRAQFVDVVTAVEAALGKTPSSYFLDDFSAIDVIFTPYVERMNASLYYYKGYALREENPRFSAWFDAMETRSTYRGTQSDFHTHVHDLPPQMGGCYSNNEPEALRNQTHVDRGPWLDLPDAKYPEPETAKLEALTRVCQHRANLIRVNPSDNDCIDIALRCALTHLITGTAPTPPTGADVALRYVCDRVNVPRDMSIYAAKHFRTSLETVAALAGDRQGPKISLRDRRDQDPKNFATSVRPA